MISVYLAIDYGSKYTGIATWVSGVSVPHEVFLTEELDEKLEKIISAEKITDIVVGICEEEIGSKIEKQKRKFLKNLEKKFPDISIHQQEEAYSTFEARYENEKKSRYDADAAVIILDRFFEFNGRF